MLAVCYVMYFFWDVLPLIAIMIYHLKAFHAEERERSKPGVDWTAQSFATTPASDSEAQSQAHQTQRLQFRPTPSAESLMLLGDRDESVTEKSEVHRSQLRSQSL